MPLDQFTYTSSPLRDYAEALLERPCYAKYGIEWNVPWQPLDRGMGPAYSAGGQRLFTIELAQQYGYHTPPNEWENKDAWRTFIQGNEQLAATAPNFDEALTDCRQQSRDALPLPSDEERYYAGDAAVQTYEEALLDEKVIGLIDEWKQCMLDEGYAEVADNPEMMPADDYADKWEIGEPASEPSDDEIAMAVADATCSSSAKWDQTLYQAQWDRQVAFVEANTDRLMRIRDAFSEDRKLLEETVAENAPTQ